MGTFDTILLKITTQHWKVAYYVTHIIAIISALALIIVSYLTHKAEHDTVGAFELNLTFNVSVMFYIASSLMLFNALLGFLAQALPGRPSLWILYCIVVVIQSVVLLTASVSATSKSNTKNYPVGQMKLTMENYNDHDPNATHTIKWDAIQEKHECCGTEGYKDWQDVHFGRTSLRVPVSCCLPKRKNNTYCGLNVLPHDDNAHDKIFTKGCLEPVLAPVQTMLITLSFLGFLFSTCCLIVATLSCYLVVTKRV